MGLERLLTSQARLIEMANHEERIAKLEKLLAKAEPEGLCGTSAKPDCIRCRISRTCFTRGVASGHTRWQAAAGSRACRGLLWVRF